MGREAQKEAAFTTVKGCERCGNPEAEVACGGRSLCLDCYYLAGSCCLEFGADDLWREAGSGST